MNQENVDMFSIEKTRNPLYLHIAKTYGWMFLGLAVTFLTALGFYYSGLIYFAFAAPFIPFVLLIAKLILVIVLTAKLHKLKPSTAKGIFIVYSFVSGIALTPIFVLYEINSAIFVFGITALFFGILAAAGLITKKDLSKFGPLVLFGLISLLILTVFNMFFHIGSFDMMVCYIGVLVFFGVTIYDSNKIRNYYYACENHPEMLEKVSILSALNLYLDFINLFLYILRLLGKKK